MLEHMREVILRQSAEKTGFRFQTLLEDRRLVLCLLSAAYLAAHYVLFPILSSRFFVA